MTEHFLHMRICSIQVYHFQSMLQYKCHTFQFDLQNIENINMSAKVYWGFKDFIAPNFGFFIRDGSYYLRKVLQAIFYCSLYICETTPKKIYYCQGTPEVTRRPSARKNYLEQLSQRSYNIAYMSWTTS